ncbi:hypothetical protein ASPFODRAFT_665080 [Aspergillus luchuensis CBS 106.47]|uniref:Uncharacterized protein n=1 Tax=Aspergillus luchuensis (strain CBS 106.47) TaxID=1137211 RepID=A0A1M3TF38_ASPLC|nr:hypothetical protein ASPFODRAFT_665080 [Aspergillus luchuensis CBS 106.47]
MSTWMFHGALTPISSIVGSFGSSFGLISTKLDLEVCNALSSRVSVQLLSCCWVSMTACMVLLGMCGALKLELPLSIPCYHA